MVVRKYTHLKIGDEFQAIGGHYTLMKEVKLKYQSREVLYTVAHTVVDNSCCGSGCWQHVLVFGYILKWQSATNPEGLPVTDVEPVTDPYDRENIKQIIQKDEVVSYIDFR